MLTTIEAEYDDNEFHSQLNDYQHTYQDLNRQYRMIRRWYVQASIDMTANSQKHLTLEIIHQEDKKESHTTGHRR